MTSSDGPGARLAIAGEGGLALAEHDGDGWQLTGWALEGRALTCVAATDGELVAGTTGGALRVAAQRGASAHDAGLGERHLRALAADGAIVLAGTEPAAILVEEDGGWSERPEVAALRESHGWWLPYSPEAGCVRDFSRHGERWYAAVEVGGLRSDDGGASWRLADGSSGRPAFGEPPAGEVHPDVHSVVVHPSSPDLVHAATAGGLFRSDDGGAGWRRLRRGCYVRAVWVDPADPEHLLLGVADSVRSKHGRIERSRDGGRSWQPASDGLETPWPDAMVERFRQSGPHLVAVLNDGRLFVSAPPGEAWQPLLPELPRVRDAAVLTG
jgi:hypothetical protein